jgi:hypothetical protein
MRKALVPMLASLALCGAGTAALIVTNARAAQSNVRKPVMVALVAPGTVLAQNGPAPAREMHMPNAAALAAQGKRMCEDRYAREVGRLAYLEARLKLTSAQQPLFARWKDVSLGIAKRRSNDCAQRMAERNGKDVNLVDRMDREEELLKRRIADLDAERPALGALYNALSPEQREALAPGPRRMMADGMMDRGRFGPPMDMGDHPPPPPQ